jgi:hypothetical protein
VQPTTIHCYSTRLLARRHKTLPSPTDRVSINSNYGSIDEKQYFVYEKEESYGYPFKKYPREILGCCTKKQLYYSKPKDTKGAASF